MVHTLLPVGLLAAVGIFLTPEVSLAQGSSRYIPPDVKGFGALQMRQRMFQDAARSSAAAAAVTQSARPYHSSTVAQPAEVNIAINIPGSWNPPASVAIQGPDGEVRNFAVEGGREALQTRVVVVRPGERVTIQLIPARPKTER